MNAFSCRRILQPSTLVPPAGVSRNGTRIPVALIAILLTLPNISFAAQPRIVAFTSTITTLDAINPENCWTAPVGINGCLQRLGGRDQMYNLWPSNFWGAGGNAGFYMILNYPNPDPLFIDYWKMNGVIKDYMSNALTLMNTRNVDNAGADDNVAVFSDLRMGPPPVSTTWSDVRAGQNPMVNRGTQNSFTIVPGPPLNPDTQDNQPRDLYVSFWVRFEPGLTKNMTGLADRPGAAIWRGGTWREFFGFKTGSVVPDGVNSNGLNVGRPVNDGNYRIGVNVLTEDSTAPYWGCTGDNNSRDHPPGDPVETYWREPRSAWTVSDPNDEQNGHWRPPLEGAVPVPEGEWFKFEAFWSRKTVAEPGGYFWAAVNGQVICEHSGWNYIRALYNTGNPVGFINRIHIPLYTGGRYPISQWIWNFQIWDQVPSAADTDHQWWCTSPYAGRPGGGGCPPP